MPMEYLVKSNTATQEPQISPSPEVEVGDRGLKKRILRRGTTRQSPCPGDEVEVHYIGNVQNGSSLGSSHDIGTPFKFKLKQGDVIEGLDVGVATMKKGERSIFTVPPQLAYKDSGLPPLVSPNSTLIFDIEMISWTTIRDVTGDGGVMKKIIVDGQGWATPKDGDEVLVKYEAKSEDGMILSKSDEFVEFHVGNGKLCPAIHSAVKTMRRNELAELSVKFYCKPVLDGSGLEDGTRAAAESDCLNRSSNIIINLELLSWRSVVDVLGDKSILKKIVFAGEGFDHPNEGSSVKAIYVGKREDGTIFDQKGSNEDPFEYKCLEDQIDESLDKAIMSMKKGEKAQVFIHSDMQANEGVSSEKTINDSRLLYEVELLDFTKEKPLWKLNTQEKIEACDKKKQDGNLLFKAGKYWLASKKYEKAVKCIEFNHNFSDNEKFQAKAQLLSCNLNNAACKLKLGDYVGAEKLCSKVLELDTDNIKALFRRSQAYMHMSYLEKAEADITRALNFDPNNRDIKHIHLVIKAKLKEYAFHQAGLFSAMVSKMV